MVPYCLALMQNVADEEQQKLLHMEDRLKARVIGQIEAVTAVSDAVRRSRAGRRGGPSSRSRAAWSSRGPRGGIGHLRRMPERAGDSEGGAAPHSFVLNF